MKVEGEKTAEREKDLIPLNGTGAARMVGAEKNCGEREDEYFPRIKKTIIINNP